MGAVESSHSSSSHLDGDGITTVSERVESVDPVLERLKNLKIESPILKTPPRSEGSFSDILVRKSVSSSLPGNFDPKVLEELFSIFRKWQDEMAGEIGKKQEEIENKIETADALAVKLLQRFNYSVSAIRTTAHHLSAVELLELEVGELKGRLTEVISNCDALCKRISTEGPESLRSIKSFKVSYTDPSRSTSI